jgi:hypothetical protein
MLGLTELLRNTLDGDVSASDDAKGSDHQLADVLSAPGSSLARLRAREWASVKQRNVQIIDRMSAVDDETIAVHNKMASFSNEVARFSDEMRALPTLTDTLEILRKHTERLCSEISVVEEVLTHSEIILQNRKLVDLKMQQERARQAQLAARKKKKHDDQMDTLSLAFEEDMARYRSTRMGQEEGNSIDAIVEGGGEEDGHDDLSYIELDLDAVQLGSFYSDDDDGDRIEAHAANETKMGHSDVSDKEDSPFAIDHVTGG